MLTDALRVVAMLLLVTLLVSPAAATTDPLRCSNPPCPPFDRPPPTDPQCREAWDVWMRSMPGAEHPQLLNIWQADYPRCWVREPATPPLRPAR